MTKHNLSVERDGKVLIITCTCKHWVYETTLPTTVQEVLRLHKLHANPWTVKAAA